MKTPRMVIVDGVRTPFCRAGSDLAGLAADELGRIAVNALLTRTGIDPSCIDEVIFGCVCQPFDAANIARVIALRAGIPESVPAITVHRNCASGCEALTQAAEKAAAGRGEIFLVGGTESMSQVPLLFPQSAAAKFTALAKARSALQKVRALAAFRPADFKPRIGLMNVGEEQGKGHDLVQTAYDLFRKSPLNDRFIGNVEGRDVHKGTVDVIVTPVP